MHSTHVLIRGHVFTYAEKAPFMPSGMSVLGALEYDEATDQTKCHECGEWRNELGHHIRQHELSRVDYNQRHGIRIKSPLTGPKKRAVATKQSRATRQRNGTPAGCAANRVKRTRTVAAFTPNSHTERNRCTAQLIYRIQVTAAKVGCTPSQTDLRAAGLRVEVIERRFGNLTRAMLAAGLNPNVVGAVPARGERRKDLPENFPTIKEIKKRWEERMPYPDGYFDSGAIGLERRG